MIAESGDENTILNEALSIDGEFIAGFPWTNVEDIICNKIPNLDEPLALGIMIKGTGMCVFSIICTALEILWIILMNEQLSFPYKCDF